MSIVPLDLPPGVFKNGTLYGARGRWFDCNLVRWHDNALRPIGGWVRRKNNTGANIPALVSDPTTETVRDVISYNTLSGEVKVLFGSNAHLLEMDGSNLITDITPVGFTAGSNQVTYLIGYGIGPYGVGPYGTNRNFTGGLAEPIGRWAFDMWGENPLALFNSEGILYEYINDANPASAVANAPSNLIDFVVTDERIVMAIRNGPTEIREVVWCDRENNTIWTSSDDNYAGSYRLPGRGNLVGIYRVQNAQLILSETDAYVSQWLGAPLVYGFRRVGTNCQPVHSAAVSKTERFAIWLGERNFWMFDGTLRTMVCDVMDHIEETLDLTHVSKIHTMTIHEFSEIWWFYQSIGGDQVDSYVVYDYVDQSWAIGKLTRTVGDDKGILRYPIMVDQNGLVWNHEQDDVKVVGDAYALSGPLEIGNGAGNLAIRYIFPDTENPNTVQLDFYTRQMPTGPEIHHGPFAFENPISTTGVMGRQVQMKITGLVAGWEVGTMRADAVSPGAGVIAR